MRTLARALVALTICAVVTGSEAAPSRMRSLPLIEIPSRSAEDRGLVAILLTGDGGLASFGRKVSQDLASRGIPVVAVNSLRYFLHRRDPASAARDMERILDRYTDAWGKKKAVLIGYSLGADVLPFIYSRMSRPAQEKVLDIALLGPALSVDFKFHLSYWLLHRTHRYPMSVEDEVQKLDRAKILCVYGERDRESLCRDASTEGMHVASVDAGHALTKHHRAIAEMIVRRQ